MNSQLARTGNISRAIIAQRNGAYYTEFVIPKRSFTTRGIC